MKAAAKYIKNVVDTLKTTLVGMRITGKYLLQKPITVQYPDERLPIPDRYRGIHYLEQEKCIDCLACARACPIDCIEMEAVRHGKELEWISFTLDYQKCMFCELCVYPCPKDCIHMGTEFAFVSYDRSEFKHDLLSFKGMVARRPHRMKEAEAKKKAKEAAKTAEAAAKAAPQEPPRQGGAGGQRRRRGAGRGWTRASEIFYGAARASSLWRCCGGGLRRRGRRAGSPSALFAILTLGGGADVHLGALGGAQRLRAAWRPSRGTAGLFLLLGADFLAMAQILIYVGGILVLLLFGVMLTPPDLTERKLSRVVSGLVLRRRRRGLGRRSRWPRTVEWAEASALPAGRERTAREIGVGFLAAGRVHVAFELAAVLLTVALVAAVYIARRGSPTSTAARWTGDAGGARLMGLEAYVAVSRRRCSRSAWSRSSCAATSSTC